MAGQDCGNVARLRSTIRSASWRVGRTTSEDSPGADSAMSAIGGANPGDSGDQGSTDEDSMTSSSGARG